MGKYPLIGGSICAVVLLVLASLTNVVGFQTVQTSNQKIITTELNEKDLLFQTIVDMTNNKQIQRVILGYELTSKRSFDSDMRFSTFKVPVITEKFLKHIFTLGVVLSGTLSRSKIQSLLERHQIINQEIQKELSAVVQKDSTLRAELILLSNLRCDCDNKINVRSNFIIICSILWIILTVLDFIWRYFGGFELIRILTEIIGFIVGMIGFLLLNCWPVPYIIN